MNIPTLTNNDASAAEPNADHRESSDRYRGELIREGDWRIAVCRDGLQWLVQHRTRAGSPDGPRWEAKHYCATKRGLERFWPGSEPAGRAFIERLPENIALWKRQVVGWKQ